MRRLILFLAFALWAAACVPPPAAKRPATNVDILVPPGGPDSFSPVRSIPVAVSGVAVGGGSGGSGSGSPGTPAAPTPIPLASPTPGKSGALVPGPNGSTLILVAEINAKKVPEKAYIPLIAFGDGKFHLKWTRGTFLLVAGSRPFTANESALIEVAIGQLNGAIGRTVFRFGGTDNGDIPITTQDVGTGDVLGVAQLIPQLVNLDRAYVEAKITMNVGNLERFAPDPVRYPDLFKTVMLHELGHVAGLDHNSQEGTLMNIKTESVPIVVGFSQNEINTLQLVYQD